MVEYSDGRPVDDLWKPTGMKNISPGTEAIYLDVDPDELKKHLIDLFTTVDLLVEMEDGFFLDFLKETVEEMDVGETMFKDVGKVLVETLTFAEASILVGFTKVFADIMEFTDEHFIGYGYGDGGYGELDYG